MKNVKILGIELNKNQQKEIAGGSIQLPCNLNMIRIWCNYNPRCIAEKMDTCVQ